MPSVDVRPSDMNVEELIENVKRYPILYDPSDKEYRNNSVRNEAWEEIGKLLDMQGNECKELWTKIRNAYTNAMKRRKSKSSLGTKNMVKWKYEDQMGFLAHIVDQAVSHGNQEVMEEGTLESEDMPQEEKYSPAQPSASSHEDNLSSSNPSLRVSDPSADQVKMEFPTSASKKARIEGSTNETFSSTKENSPVRTQSCSSDEIDMFFLSLSKTVQRLRPEEQVRIKMEVSNSVFQAEFRELQRHSHLADSSNSSMTSNLNYVSSSQPIHLSTHSCMSSSPHLKSPTSASNAMQNET